MLNEVQFELLLPLELLEIIQRDVLGDELASRPRYSRVIMPLKDLLTGAFFNEYIKKGPLLNNAR